MRHRLVSSVRHPRRPWSGPSRPAFLASRLRVPLLGALATLAACGGDGTALTAPPPAGSSLTVTYSGPAAGTLRAEGTPSLSGPMLGQTFAVAYPMGGGGPYLVHATRGAAASDDWVDVQLPAARAGTFAIDTDRCGWWDAACPNVHLALEVPRTNAAQARHTCRLDRGTIEVTATGGGRLRGTFRGTGACITATGAVVDGFAVTAGAFDVAVLTRPTA